MNRVIAAAVEQRRLLRLAYAAGVLTIGLHHHRRERRLHGKRSSAALLAAL